MTGRKSRFGPWLFVKFEVTVPDGVGIKGVDVNVKKIMAWFLVILALAVVTVAGCKTSRSGYDSAPYQVVRTSGKFEVRDYPALTVVETPMRAAGGKDADGGFGRLFRFITGANESNQKIAMTTPVFMSGGQTNQTMAFVMPANLSTKQVPKPKDQALSVRVLAPGRFAVLRFSGGRNPRHEADSLRRLEEWMTTEGLNSGSPPVYGYFDPPWTPAFLRRNEVMLLVGRDRP